MMVSLCVPLQENLQDTWENTSKHVQHKCNNIITDGRIFNEDETLSCDHQILDMQTKTSITECF